MIQPILQHPRVRSFCAGIVAVSAVAAWPADAQEVSHSGPTLIAASTNGSPSRPSTAPGAKDEPVAASGSQTVLEKEKARREQATVRPWEKKPKAADSPADHSSRSNGAAGKASSTGSTDHAGMGGSGAAAGGGGTMDDRARK